MIKMITIELCKVYYTLLNPRITKIYGLFFVISGESWWSVDILRARLSRKDFLLYLFRKHRTNSRYQFAENVSHEEIHVSFDSNSRPSDITIHLIISYLESLLGGDLLESLELSLDPTAFPSLGPLDKDRFLSFILRFLFFRPSPRPPRPYLRPLLRPREKLRLRERGERDLDLGVRERERGERVREREYDLLSRGGGIGGLGCRTLRRLFWSWGGRGCSLPVAWSNRAALMSNLCKRERKNEVH